MTAGLSFRAVPRFRVPRGDERTCRCYSTRCKSRPASPNIGVRGDRSVCVIVFASFQRSHLSGLTFRRLRDSSDPVLQHPHMFKLLVFEVLAVSEEHGLELFFGQKVLDDLELCAT